MGQLLSGGSSAAQLLVGGTSAARLLGGGGGGGVKGAGGAASLDKTSAAAAGDGKPARAMIMIAHTLVILVLFYGSSCLVRSISLTSCFGPMYVCVCACVRVFVCVWRHC